MTEESNAWVFDSLIGFLHGPVWNAPLQTFIEEKSLSKLINTNSPTKFFWSIVFVIDSLNCTGKFLFSFVFFFLCCSEQFLIQTNPSMKITKNIKKSTMNISIWLILCWEASWKRCKLRRNNLKWLVWPGSIVQRDCHFTRVYFNRFLFYSLIFI